MMRASQSTRSTVNFISMAWRKFPSSVSNASWKSNHRSLLPVIQQFGTRRFSSVTPETKTKREAEESNNDPFGLDDVISSDDSTLVQGFYQKSGVKEKPEDHQNQASQASVPPKPQQQQPVSNKTSNSSNTDVKANNRLSEYDSWLKQREEFNASLRSETGETENYRETNFGTVRIDTDNPGRHQQSQQQRGPSEDFRLNFQQKRRRNRAMDETSSEPVIETIEADHSIRMRASDFLEQMQKGTRTQGAQEEENVGGEREKTIIEKVIWPKKVPSMDVNHPDNYAVARKDPHLLDSHVVPKEYLLPEYNAITELDMWAILKKSIIFQNDFLLALNKPAGIPVHSKSVDCRHTIIQFLKNFADLAKCEEVYPLHRLDKETTGILLFAKDKKIASVLKEKFALRQVSKAYLGVTKLCPKIPEGTIKIPIGEGLIPGTKKYRRVLRPDLREYGIKPTTRSCVEAITNYKVVNSIEEAAFLEIEPVTGIKHQIRVHLGLGLGCPVIGDHKYSHRDKLAPQRLHPHVLHQIKIRQSKVRELPLHLHCNKISFTLPKEFTNSTEPVHIHAKIPFYMRYTLKRLGLIR